MKPTEKESNAHSPALRPRVDDELILQFFVELTRTLDALKPHKAVMAKATSNLNQIDQILKADPSTPESIMKLLEATIQEHRAAVQNHEQAIRDLMELRTAGLNANGWSCGTA